MLREISEAGAIVDRLGYSMHRHSFVRSIEHDFSHATKICASIPAPCLFLEFQALHIWICFDRVALRFLCIFSGIGIKRDL
jgi:hypothetical protein